MSSTGRVRRSRFESGGIQKMLVTCSECGQKVSNKAKACPHCGAPIGEGGEAVEVSSLKRSVALVFAIFLCWLGAHNA